MTTFASANAAVRAYLASNWTATPVYEGPEPTPEPDQPEPFVKVRVMGQTGRTASVNGGHDRRNITFRATVLVTLFTPVGTGDALAVEYASQLERLFSLARIPDTSGGRIECDVAAIEQPIPADEAGRWRSTTIRVPGRYFDRMR